VVEVEERGLRSFEQHVLVRFEGLVHEVDRVGDHRRDPWRAHVEVLGGDVVGRQRELVVDLGQDRVLLFEDHVELLAEDLGVEQVLHAQADARRLVGVGRADAALGGAQLVLAQPALDDLVELLVVREDQVGVAADDEPAGVDALAGQHVELGQQHTRIDHDAVGDDRNDVVVQDPARHQLEGEALAVHDDGVPGVVAALVADHQVHLLGDEVGELPLPLITPLGPDDNGRRHATTSR
jgi:hypothetical protein